MGTSLLTIGEIPTGKEQCWWGHRPISGVPDPVGIAGGFGGKVPLGGVIIADQVADTRSLAQVPEGPARPEHRH